ncbi:helix-turn-helix transcriptional regulator [Rhizobiales bacterium]|uniref:helix-turn-helix domain-containing protein n=1 Tax=Hongsoonwoonella zoysiae TaxID=2821844 RepID=UPI001560D8A1|nr:helix-turn-helix transcriptional regulator [Hongsoonwoonella zoysiae]NRG19999.1 helix-turn-helix transcriptional regulator [Hongsoonwoonella zoysiae]
MATDLARNLRLLCSYTPSISQVCRDLGINRQQFTKYLNASARPSDRNLRRICDYFGVAIDEIMMPHGQFSVIVAVAPKTQNMLRALGPAAPALNAMIESSEQALERYRGYYYYYYFTPSRPGHIRRSLLRLHERNGIWFSRLTERVQAEASPMGRSHYSHYLGIAFFLGDRITIVDYNARNQTSLSQTLLYPAQGKELKFLSGITLGVQGRSARAPFAARLFLEYLGPECDRRTILGKTGVFAADDPGLPPYIREVISARELEHSDILKAYELLP